MPQLFWALPNFKLGNGKMAIWLPLLLAACCIVVVATFKCQTSPDMLHSSNYTCAFLGTPSVIRAKEKIQYSQGGTTIEPKEQWLSLLLLLFEPLLLLLLLQQMHCCCPGLLALCQEATRRMRNVACYFSNHI